MKEFRVRQLGKISWLSIYGYDCHDAIQEYGKYYDFQTAELTLGNKVTFEVMEVGKQDIKLVALYADFVVKYFTEDI